MHNGNIIFIAGHARLPEGMAAQSMFHTLTVTAELDRQYGVILQCSCTLVTEHGRDFIHHLLQGYSLLNGVQDPVNAIEQNYFGKAKKAIIVALKDLYTQYEVVRKERTHGVKV
ncbi:DUF3870 domain-containing protein [Halobacillus shinanisalinarum]|uniref:DUF3870 domain-containing protein n=1 Tax=Halobacillus shinanisalinarum TaxID=2932258 RepID=A0ABY4GVD3_9BACI|nr:DUF3870 domain-containing protein [Halobacillus shinanisalinarum]UOQ91860.1 DUF3870 domain-containing protein [Halobacillus shinanisalinarum]